MRVIEVVANAGHIDTLRGIAEQHEAMDIWCGTEDDDGRRTLRILVAPTKRQAMLDALQSALSTSENYHILVQPVNAVLPRPQRDEDKDKAAKVSTTREELYSQIERGARLDRNYLLLVVLSTIVAAIGLVEDNVAVVVGAMVIAPLLGPILAFAFGTSLGDRQLVWHALTTGLSGLVLAIALSALLGMVWTPNLDSNEIMSRTDVGLDGIALALASGAAAVISLTTGLPTALVGVMVAVALLPPAATLGLLLSAWQLQLAAGTVLLLAVNVVSVVLAANLVFLSKGVKPRTWLEKRKAEQSTRLYLALWILMLGLLVVAILVRGTLE